MKNLEEIRDQRVSLFEVQVRNHVVKGSFKLRSITGTQGCWYIEKRFYLASDESEAEQMAKEEVSARRVLGVPLFTRRRLQRQVEILGIRRLA